MDINSLIKKITPLYNEYKLKSKSISGTNALLIMWDIGDVIKDYVNQNDVSPNSLYRDVYGNSEGGTNTTKKSWITREFQSRCYRIRNMFEDKNQIYADFPTLVGFTSFRECMPFLENEKYKFKGDEKIKLLKLLNSNKSKSFILKEIRKLQADKIGIKNSRNQRLVDLEFEKTTFIDFYNHIYRLGDKNTEEILADLSKDSIQTELLKTIAKNTSALSTDGLRFFEFNDEIIKKDILMNKIWINYINVLKDFRMQPDPKKIRRFRRLIPPERIVKLADMLNNLHLKIE